ncbi:hypothetical protein ACLX1H_002881 [Fusarium chlamydosporum]
MQIKAILFAAFATYGMVDAGCYMRAMSGPNCTGEPGAVRHITRANVCINVEGRQSYLVHGADCKHVRHIKYWKKSCGGTPDQTNDLPSGKCYNVGPAERMNIKMV